jgi:hypothetical protein
VTRVRIVNPNGTWELAILSWPFETLLEWYGPAWDNHNTHHLVTS